MLIMSAALGMKDPMMDKKLAKAEKLIFDNKFEEGHKLCLEILEKDPQCAHAYYLIAHINVETRSFVLAVQDLNRAIYLDKKNAAYLAEMARALTPLAIYNNAKKAAGEAAQYLQEDDDRTRFNIWQAYFKMALYEDSLPFIERLVKRNPDNAHFHFHLATTVQTLGDLERAEQEYNEAIRAKPKMVTAYSGLAYLKKYQAGGSLLEKLMELFESEKEADNNALVLGHAIAKCYEDVDDYKQAAAWLERAKKKQVQDCDFTLKEQEEIFNAAKKTISIKSSKGFESDEPIFIFGMPRTGTTLVDRIISSHSQVTTAGELNLFPKAIKRFSGSKTLRSLDADTFEKSKNINFEQAGQFYIENSRHLTGQTPRFTDKMPANSYYAALIHKALPNAKMICLRRHPMDACLSNYRQIFNAEQKILEYTFDVEWCAEHYLQFDELMAHWRENLPGDRFMEISYEDIIADQEGATRKLIEFCDLPWEDQCLDFHKNEAPVATASINQVRQPLYKTSVARWKKYGTFLDPMRKILEAKLGPME